jgi:RNA polymerase sigma-70 factor (ECF subfamily)
MMPESDVDLMLRCRHGDRTALGELVRRYEEPLINFLHRMLGDIAEAEDLFQETFLRILRSAPAYEPKAAFSTWLYTIARHLCIDRFKKRKGLSLTSLDGRADGEEGNRAADLPDQGPGPLENVDGGERAQIVRGALAQLTDKKREVLMMRVYLGLPYGEIAEILGAPLGTVKYRIHDALKDLSKILQALPR